MKKSGIIVLLMNINEVNKMKYTKFVHIKCLGQVGRVAQLPEEGGALLRITLGLDQPPLLFLTILNL